MKKNLKFISLILSILLITLASSGCAKQVSENNSKKPITVGVVSISTSDSNNARFINGAKDEAKKLGWNIIVTDANGSADLANAGIENFVTKKVNAIIDMVFPVTSISTGLIAASNAKIPVGTWGGGMGQGVAVTNGSGGPIAKPIIEKMISDMGGKGSILALTYHTGQVARDRELILDEILKSYPQIKVTKNEVRIPGTQQDGAAYTNAWLASHKDNSEKLAIWGSWDDPALGAISALKQQGRHDVLVYGENGNADAILAVKDGWMTATAWEDAYAEGVKMIDILKDAIETISKGGSWKPVSAEVPPIVITSKNVDQFIKDHPEAMKN